MRHEEQTHSFFKHCCTQKSPVTMTKRSRDEARLDNDPLASDGSDYDSEESGEESGCSGARGARAGGALAGEWPRGRPGAPRQALASAEQVQLRVDKSTQADTVHELLIGAGTGESALRRATAAALRAKLGRSRGSLPCSRAGCSALRCACLDPDGQKQDKKIHATVGAAKRARAQLERLLAASQERCRPASGGEVLPLPAARVFHPRGGFNHPCCSSTLTAQLQPLQVTREARPGAARAAGRPSSSSARRGFGARPTTFSRSF